MIKQIALHGVQLSSEPVFERSTSGISVKFVATPVCLFYIYWHSKRYWFASCAKDRRQRA